MFTSRKLPFRALFDWLTKHILLLLVFNGTLSILYFHNILTISIPWLPVSVIGTAVAFFVGFKNNQAYERMWEARKIWGGIVNDSRTWGMLVDSFIRKTDQQTDAEIKQLKQKLFYRHIIWLYTHRHQLLQPMSWEQQGVGGITGKYAKIYKKSLGLGALDNNVSQDDVEKLMGKEEFDRMKTYKNMATQLINQQSRDLIELHDKKHITRFQHKQMIEVLRTLYELQGRNERIKNFPFPRDYSMMSNFFIWVFLFLLPFSLIPELMKLGNWDFWISIPVAVLIGLVYIIMEDLGDYHENPFMGTPHAMPMLSMCRSIEIDLREMLGEGNLPSSIQSKNGVLM